MKNKLKQLSKIPSKTSYAWAVYLYIWIFTLTIILLLLSLYGKPIHMGPNQMDIILLIIIFGSIAFSIAAAIQIIANIIYFRREKPDLNFKQVVINLLLLAGILIFLFYTAFGD